MLVAAIGAAGILVPQFAFQLSGDDSPGQGVGGDGVEIVSVTVSAFSPNQDGIQDSTEMVADLIVNPAKGNEVAWELSILDPSGTLEVRNFSGNKSLPDFGTNKNNF